MGNYDERDRNDRFYVIPFEVNSSHGIKCPCCSKWNNYITSKKESYESHNDTSWSCKHCKRPFQIYICSNCDQIAAIAGRKGHTKRNCRCCRTKNLKNNWCFDDYSYGDDDDNDSDDDYYDEPVEYSSFHRNITWKCDGCDDYCRYGVNFDDDEFYKTQEDSIFSCPYGCGDTQDIKYEVWFCKCCNDMVASRYYEHNYNGKKWRTCNSCCSDDLTTCWSWEDIEDNLYSQEDRDNCI